MTNDLLADGHVHLFNAGFLPIEGVLMSRGVPKWAAEPFADFIESKIERDWPPPPPAQQSAGERENQKLYEMLETELTGESGRDFRRRPDLIKRVVEYVSEDDLAKLGPALKRFRRSRTKRGGARKRRVSAGTVDDSETLEQLLRAVDAKAGQVETGETALTRGALTVRTLVEWILLMLIHESRIEKCYSQAWDGNQSVGLRVHHMMDMERHYPSNRVLYPLAERHRRMRAVKKNASSPLLGFLAFDPFRDDCQKIIEDAIRTGFTGVKFYPPNGYRPIGNVAKEIKNGPPPAVVDERNLKLFRFCVNMDVPIFAHCSRLGGMESRPGETGKFADPAGWREVLRNEGLHSLRLCLGHAGGQKEWFEKSENDFRKSDAGVVLELCTDYPNVYCDFGFFDWLLDRRKVKRFATRLTAAIEADPRVGDKCCFGTDWHMVSRLKSRPYISRFQEVMQATPLLQQYKAKFFGGNLLNYLKNP